MKKILFTLLMMGAFLLPVPAQEKEYVILVHGGAGVMTALQDHPEQRDIFYKNIIISDKRSLSLYPVLCNNE